MEQQFAEIMAHRSELPETIANMIFVAFEDLKGTYNACESWWFDDYVTETREDSLFHIH